ncbi:MAG: DinB family protein [Marinoscillum sp.]
MQLTTFFQDLFEYHHHFNQLLLDELVKHQDIISERTVLLYSHVINAHQIWNTRILGGVSLGVNDVHTLQKCKKLDDENSKNSFRIIKEFDLNQRISYQNSRGDQFENTTHEMLFQVVNHTTHHRGQIISDLRKSGVAPIVTDYIFYKRKRDV